MLFKFYFQLFFFILFKMIEIFDLINFEAIRKDTPIIDYKQSLKIDSYWHKYIAYN